MAKFFRIFGLCLTGFSLFSAIGLQQHLCAGQNAPVVQHGKPAITNGGFEDGLSGWKRLWTREPEAGRVVLDNQVVHSGHYSVRIDFSGSKDWSFMPDLEIPADSDTLFELSSWVKISGSGAGVLGVITYDDQGVIDWTYAGVSPKKTADWQYIKTRFRTSGNIVKIIPRWIGEGPATIWIDDFQIHTTPLSQTGVLPPSISITNPVMDVTLDTRNNTLTVFDKRSNFKWRQVNLHNDLWLLDAKSSGQTIAMRMESLTSGLRLNIDLTLDLKLPEFDITIAGNGSMPQSIGFPEPFVTDTGTYLIVPLNEGISYPVNDPSIHPMRLIAYGGHGICMSFWGVTDGVRGQMAIIETPDDASIQIERYDQKLCITPFWDPEKERFGYSRRIKYLFFDEGGFVAMCKKYRSYIQAQGRLHTLAQKRLDNPNVDLLVGAANIWCWDQEPLSIVKEMKAAGMDKILWSAAGSPEIIAAMNQQRVLTGRYDIYQDVMDPERFPTLRYVDSNWPTHAWPGDIIIDSAGQWEKGWEIETKDNKLYPCGVLCDSKALQYAAERIPVELKSHPYRARFIDTTTAAPWRECYHPDHPMTRSQSRQEKMRLLEYISNDMKLIAGSETGHDAAVPYVHYFEGMMSLGPYRIDDAGRNMGQILSRVPQQIRQFQLGHEYRLPLWELVYHDCVTSYWYWGDYNNKIPAVWEKRDLFNILYATPPMFMFDRALWTQNRSRFIRSYRNITPVLLNTGYSEMTDFRFLTPDRNVQQSLFANGTKITVNFGKTAFRMPDGRKIKAMGWLFDKGDQQALTP